MKAQDKCVIIECPILQLRMVNFNTELLPILNDNTKCIQKLKQLGLIARVKACPITVLKTCVIILLYFILLEFKFFLILLGGEIVDW